MPAVLEPYQRQLLYKTKKHHILKADPGVFVQMDDGEEIKLEPMDPYDKPAIRQSCAQLVHFLRENDSDAAWNNVAPFLRGAVLAKVNLPADFYARLVRTAYQVGRDRIIMHCIERPTKTGLSLRQEWVSKEAMLGLHQQAVRANFEGPGMGSIVRRAERLARMLEDQLGETSKLGEHESDVRTSPLVLAVLLELTAEKALHRQAGMDLNGQVANYAFKLLHLEEKVELTGLAEMPLYEQNMKLLTAVLVKNSIEWALKIGSVKESDLGAQLNNERNSLTKALESAISEFRIGIEAEQKKKQRCLIFYDELYGNQKGESS